LFAHGLTPVGHDGAATVSDDAAADSRLLLPPSARHPLYERSSPKTRSIKLSTVATDFTVDTGAMADRD
jgi:hypothetical protein